MTSTALGQRVDIEQLRLELRRMSRGNLLSVAYRAIELVPLARLGALVAGMVRLDLLPEGKRGATSLVLRKKSVHDEFVNKNLRETLDCSP